VPDCRGLVAAIDACIAKADDDLADVLADEGFAEAEESVLRIANIEAGVADALESETAFIAEAANKSVDIDTFVKDTWPGIKLTDALADKVTVIFSEQLSEFMPSLIAAYLAETDRDLILAQVSKHTTAWVADWSDELGEIMKLNSHVEIERILTRNIEKGKGIQQFVEDISDSRIRDSYYKARRVAVTEVLRAHSYACEEAIQQSPAAEYKEWIHTGNYRNEPRQNHIAMNGQLVDKKEPFTLIGADGGVYFPLCPLDTSLPAGESINCHCKHRGVPSERILGLPLEERKRLQAEAVAEMDDEWEKELNARNKARAGIYSNVPDSKRRAPEEITELGRIKGYTETQQIKYMGGKQKWALYESGVIKDDEMLQKVKNSTLKELNDEGILTIGTKTLKHSNIGNYAKPSKTYPYGRLKSGGHGQDGMSECNLKGIDYTVTGTYNNGVRIGSVPTSDSKKKRAGEQSWFPDSWTAEDIRVAGTYVANSETAVVLDYQRIDVYNGVAVRVLKKSGTGEITTICPDLDQGLYAEGVKLL
jgi:hypothetical protein